MLLAAAVRGVLPAELLLVHSGPLPGLGPGATRLILDVREHGADARCIPARRGLVPDLHGFAAAVVWPRAHLGKDFSEACLARGAAALRPGGQLFCAVRKAKGGPSLAKAMTELCGHVEIQDRSAGYALYVSTKTSAFDPEAARVRLERSYEVADPLLGPTPLLAAPGVFCRKHLDDGTRALLTTLEDLGVIADRSPRWVLDLGAGIGPLTLWAARRWPDARVLAVDSNFLAVDLLTDNAARFGCAPRVQAFACDGLAGLPKGDLRRGQLDLALVNPPTHADADDFAALLTPLREWLRPGAPAWLVVNRAPRLVQVLAHTGARFVAHDVAGFTVLRASWSGDKA